MMTFLALLALGIGGAAALGIIIDLAYLPRRPRRCGFRVRR